MKSAVIPIAEPLSLKKIVAATDFSCASAGVPAITSTLARCFGSEVTIAHVCGWNPDMKTEDYAKSQMAQALRSPDLEGLNLRTAILRGDPATELLALAAHSCDLVILGTHGQTGFKHFLLGSVAEEVFRRATCPVLTVGPHARWGVRRERVTNLLVPTDLSEESTLAVPYACTIAAEYGATIHFLHVLPTETAGNPDVGPLSLPLIERMRHLISPQVPPSCKQEYIARSGPEAEMIVAIANERKAELIVMALRGGSATASLRSTIAYGVITSAMCPVLTIRSR